MSVVWRGRHLAVRDDGGWESVTRPNATGVVAIVALTDDGGLVLVEQPRPPVRTTVVELPAGLVGDVEHGEALLDAAKRELIEETGYAATSWTRLSAGPVSAGLTDEQPVLFVARGLTKVAEGGGDASESITVHVVPLADALAFLRAADARGARVDPKVWVGLWAAGVPWDGQPLS